MTMYNNVGGRGKMWLILGWVGKEWLYIMIPGG